MQTNLIVNKENLILVFGKGSLHAVSGIDGEVLWTKDFAAERYVNLHYNVSDVILYIIKTMFHFFFLRSKHHCVINTTCVASTFQSRGSTYYSTCWK